MNTLLPQNPEKPQLFMRRCEVWKIHRTEAAAKLEAEVAGAYADLGCEHGVQVSRPLAVTRVLPRGFAVRYRRIEGDALRRIGSVRQLRKLIFALALYHARFATAVGSAIVRYRDALPMNVIASDDGLWQVDFSSCASFVHAFDDLALLINQRFVRLSAVQTRDLIDTYLGWRRSLDRGQDLDVTSESALATLPSAVRSAYLRKVTEMEEETANRREHLEGLDRIDFETVRPSDFEWFKVFRERRLAHYEKNVWQRRL
ncbi:MAG: hypothetical protein JJU00_20135 [Opitutales bacterium]|nr:hypothetical protein [Opitutales bacterium]